jgi:hypothetical protein
MRSLMPPRLLFAIEKIILWIQMLMCDPIKSVSRSIIEGEKKN